MPKISNLITVFPNIICRYEYHNGSYTHFVEVTPKSIYDSNEYINMEEGIVNEFEEKFIGECLCFLSTNSHYTLKNPITIKKEENV